MSADDREPVGDPAASPDVEQVVAAVWAEVLDVDAVTADDNFFDLGGQSLLASQVALRLRDALNIDVPERALFDWPTVAGLSAALPRYQSMSVDTGTPELAPRRRASSGH